jgi:cytochrome c biogenesis protein CcmG, thiol:disulfide interchange protein DsbE
MRTQSINRFLIPLAAFFLLVVVLWIGIRHSPEVGTIKSPLVGKPAPAWQLPTLTDSAKQFGSANLRGEWYVLNVWGTWCGACRQEHDALMQVQRESPIPIIGLNWRDDDAQALDWLARLGNPYRTVAVDHDGHTVIQFGVYGAPETFLVNPEGIIVHKLIGPMTPEVWRKDFASRLPARSPANPS